ncbi:MAG: permease-like cell division protein FtsX [Gammaproteobacteria bacterium]
MNKLHNISRFRSVSAQARSNASQFSLRHYGLCHLQAAIASLGRLYRAPLASFMTVAVIAITLALPAGLYVLLSNVQAISANWDNSSSISLFLKVGTGEHDAQNLLRRLELRRDVLRAKYISPEQGLKEFKQQSGFSDAVAQLPDNPLPPVIEIYPTPQIDSTHALENMLQSLQRLPHVDMAQLDVQWVKRLYSIVNIAQRAVYALAILLALGVLLVIGNTIRLATQNYKREIEVIKLVGATDAFICRPFLYTGVFYGLFGGIFAWWLVDIFLWWLSGPVQHLVGLYHSHYQLQGLGFSSIMNLLLLSMLLGWLGSKLAVMRHIREIEP